MKLEIFFRDFTMDKQVELMEKFDRIDFRKPFITVYFPDPEPTFLPPYAKQEDDDEPDRDSQLD